MINYFFKLIFGLTIFSLYLFLSYTNKFHAQEREVAIQYIISKGSDWSYFDDAYLTHKDWMKQQFLPTSEWKTGKAPLGYHMSDLATTISFGQDSSKKILTSYYHKTFFIKNPSDFYAYNLKIRRDDGAVVYLNGKEVWRTNMPGINIIKDDTKAEKRIQGSEENEFYTKVLFPNNFLSGINIIAVEVHQIHENTSDSVFDLELSRTNNLNALKAFLVNQDNQNIDLKEEIKTLNFRLEIERLARELKSTETRKAIMELVLIFSGFMLLIGVIIIILLVKDKTKVNMAVRDLKEVIKLKEKELLNLSLTNIQNKQQIGVIREDLSEILNSMDALGQKNIVVDLKRLVKKITLNLNQEDEWLELQRHFDLVHSGFFTRLKKEYPALVHSELRHCSLIKLHLSTKEIAKYLFISPKSVQASRYRIKKKMQLDESVDLKNYLLNY